MFNPKGFLIEIIIEIYKIKIFFFFKEISHKSHNALQGYDIEHNDISEVGESHFSEQADGVATTELNMPMEKC